MSNKQNLRVVRRSVALPGALIREAISLAAPELRTNVNRLVTTALKEFVERRKRLNFAAAMEKMSRDPAIRKECKAISDEFSFAERDGL